jgi:hypothetical protein
MAKVAVITFCHTHTKKSLATFMCKPITTVHSNYFSSKTLPRSCIRMFM